MEGICEKYGIK